MAQTRWVADRLRALWPGLAVDVVPMDTAGDRLLDQPLPEIGGKGVFTAELEAGLMEGRFELAVHSLKDLPTQLPEGLAVVAIPVRAPAHDLLLTAGNSPTGMADLPPSAIVGTSSPRRAAQLLALRPDCIPRAIRGNVGTRLAKLGGGEFDAILAAEAGVLRLGLDSGNAARLLAPEWLPAPAQGALAVEARAQDPKIRALVGPLEDPFARASAEAERAVLAALGGGCQLPLGAWASGGAEELTLHAGIFAPDGSRVVRVRLVGCTTDAPGLGARVAGRLLAGGAGELLAELRRG